MNWVVGGISFLLGFSIACVSYAFFYAHAVCNDKDDDRTL